jgi:hypothetical protein
MVSFISVDGSPFFLAEAMVHCGMMSVAQNTFIGVLYYEWCVVVVVVDVAVRRGIVVAANVAVFVCRFTSM